MIRVIQGASIYIRTITTVEQRGVWCSSSLKMASGNMQGKIVVPEQKKYNPFHSLKTCMVQTSLLPGLVVQSVVSDCQVMSSDLAPYFRQD